MSRWFLAIGPALLLVSCVARAFATDPNPGAVAVPPSAISVPMPGGEFLLSLGPYGALVWGAYLLGKGVKVTVQIELSDRDRELITSFGKAA